jgi:hypothetical protein
VTGLYSVSFERDHVLAGTFADRFSFVSPVEGFFSFELHSRGPLPTSGTLFGGYQFSGGPVLTFRDFPSPGFSQPDDVAIEGIPVDAGPQLLLVEVVAAPGLPPRTEVSAGYTGTFSVTAVPEPQTWLLMALGLLAVTFSMRWRRRADHLRSSSGTAFSHA